jgi:hypothetical protein
MMDALKATEVTRKFSNEMHNNDYLVMIGSINPKSDRYLKIHEDGTISFAILTDCVWERTVKVYLRSWHFTDVILVVSIA